MKFNDPIPKYTTQANGDVTIEWLPPTPLMQTAQREVEKLNEIIGGQQRTMQTMQEHINYLETHIQNLDNVIMELKNNNGNVHTTSSPHTTSTSVGESEPKGGGSGTPS
jgi:hypothetical protein